MAIIISHKPGQLGNRLILYSHFLCFGKEYGISVFNPSFHNYATYFEGTKNGFISCSTIAYFVCYSIARILDKCRVSNKWISCRHIDWNQEVELIDSPSTRFLFSRLCFVQGWRYRNYHLLVKHREWLIPQFKPAERYNAQIEEFFLRKVDTSKTFVGIHVRRGDYREFEGGKYFYEVKTYLDVMMKIRDLMGRDAVQFIVCSNDQSALSDILNSEYNCVAAPGHELVDMYCLTKCSYVVGPPSTFSLWASFYGNVPLYSMKKPDVDFTLNDFQTINYF